MKVGSKRRRTKQEILDQKSEALIKQQAIEEKLAKYDQLQQELQEAKQKAEANSNAREIVNEMLEQGYVEVNDDGQLQPSQNMIK